MTLSCSLQCPLERRGVSALPTPGQKSGCHCGTDGVTAAGAGDRRRPGGTPIIGRDAMRRQRRRECARRAGDTDAALPPRRRALPLAALLCAAATAGFYNGACAQAPPPSFPVDDGGGVPAIVPASIYGATRATVRVFAASAVLRPSGSWGVITNYGTESAWWMLTDLTTGDTIEATGCNATGYGDSALGALTTRAANGRVFLIHRGVQSTGAGPGVVLYDPATDRLRCVNDMLPASDDYMFFSTAFSNVPGSTLMYWGSMSRGTRGPAIVELDTATLAHRLLGRVGGARLSYSYAYEMGFAHPWLYVDVGQDPWRVVAFNVETREERTLLDLSQPPWSSFPGIRPSGLTPVAATPAGQPFGIVGFVPYNGTYHRYFVAGGALYAPARLGMAGGTYDPASYPAGVPFSSFTNVSGRTALYTDVYGAGFPEFDSSYLSPSADGRGSLLVRANASAPWREVVVPGVRSVPGGVSVANTTLDPCAPVGENVLIGSAQQYMGLFKLEAAAGWPAGAAGPGAAGAITDTTRSFALSRGPRTVFNGSLWAVATRTSPCTAST